MFDLEFWWMFPLLMIVVCFFMMRGRMGSMMCGHNSHGQDGYRISDSDSPMDILDKRYALGEINREEYKEKKRVLNRHD